MTWKTTNTAKGENKLYSDARGVVPSLDLRFASQKNLNDYMTGTPLVDHQRNMNSSSFSPGTFVNSSGLIETAKANYALYSETLTASWWSGIQFTSISDTTDVNPPTGIQDIYKITETADTGEHYFRGSQVNLAITAGVPNGTVVTHSIYLNTSLGRSKIRVYSFGQNNLTFIWDLVNNVQIGTIGGGTSPTINSQSLGNNWYRFSFTDVATVSSNLRPSFQTVNDSNQFNFTGDTTKGFYASGFQLEIGSTATTYIPTTNVPSAAPRFDHNPTTGESLGLLIEEARTNLFDYSTDLTQWTAFNSAPPVASSEIAPDGSTDAYKLNINIGPGSYFTRNVPTVAGSVYTISVWAKNVPGEQNFFDLFFNTSGNVQLGKTALTDTWTRYHITGNATQTGNVLAGINNPPDDYTARGLFWGFQFELGSFPTSYIPTTGTALTRSADTASITGSNFSSWFNLAEGTMFSDLQTINTSCFGWNLSDGSNNNRFVFDPGVNTGTAAALVSGGATTFGTSPTVLAGGGKIAFAYKPNDYGVYGNQTQLAGTSPAAVPTGLNQIGLGYRGNYAPDAYLNGTISRFTYFPERLPDATLQAITA